MKMEYLHILNELHKNLNHNRMGDIYGGCLTVNDNHDKSGINNDGIENNMESECVGYLNISNNTHSMLKLYTEKYVKDVKLHTG